MFTPILFPQLASEFETRDSDTDLQLLVEAGSFRSSTHSPSNQPKLNKVLPADYVGIVEGQLPFGLFLSTTPTLEFCIVFLNAGLPHITLHNATNDAGQWALGVYNKFYQMSQSLEQWQSSSTTASGPL